MIDSILDDLFLKHYSIQENFLAQEVTEALYKEGTALWNLGDFRSAKIGKGNEEQLRSEIRSDKIHWLNPLELSENQQIYFDKIDELRLAVNQTFYYGLQEFEAHFAVYPEGSFYKKHLDQFAKNPNRYVTCLLYLNKDWKPKHGGQLRVYLPDSDNYFDVEPTFGKFVCFLSASLYHEVIPSNRERFSLTGWLRKEVVL